MKIKTMGIAMGMAVGLTCAVALAQSGGDAPPVSDAEPAPAQTLTLLDLLLRGGPLMYPLGLCSVVVVAFALERGRALRRARILPIRTEALLREALRAPDAAFDGDGLRRQLEVQNDPLARVALAGLRKARRSIQEIEKAIEDAGAKEAGRLRRNCRVLSMVASIAPLLGLTGTVTGMIKSFMTVASRAEALGRTELLAAGIYEALVTTAVGLAIAIPALVLYYFYMEKVESFVVELDSIAEELAGKIPTQG